MADDGKGAVGAEGAVHALEEAVELGVAVRDLDADEFGVVLLGGVDVAVLVVDVTRDVFGQPVARVAESVPSSIDVERVEALGALAGVVLKVV